MSRGIEQAFLDVSEGWSPDRVIADPELNAKFIRRCLELRLTDSPEDLNRSLLNLRKRGAFKGHAKSRRTTFLDLEEYRYAAELAVRRLELQQTVTLDQVLCSPQLAQTFDKIAAEIRPGFTPLQYRWAALSLRKTSRLQPEVVNRLVRTEATQLGLIEKIDWNAISRQQGLYLFHTPSELLYIGEAANLRTRIEKHLDHSDNKNLARWLWEHGYKEVRLEIRVLPSETTTAIRRAVEAELIRGRSPRFNIQRRHNKPEA